MNLKTQQQQLSKKKIREREFETITIKAWENFKGPNAAIRTTLEVRQGTEDRI